MSDAVNHPKHYGGADSPYEAIRVIEAWELDFNLGNAVKYLARAGKKGPIREDLEKAIWYINRKIANLDRPFAYDVLKTGNAKCPDCGTVVPKELFGVHECAADVS